MPQLPAETLSKPITARDSQSGTQPDLHALEKRESIALLILAGLSVFYTLYVARAIMLPITLSVLLSLTLRPVVRRLRRWKLPDSAGAGLVLVVMIAIFLLVAGNLVGPAREWVHSFPEHVEELKQKWETLRDQLDDVVNASNRVQELAVDAERPPVQVQIAQSPLLANITLISNTGNVLASSILVLCLTYFLLACGDRLLNNVLHLLDRWSDKKRTVELVYDVERGIASYLLTVTVINIALGIATAIVMWLLDVPNPALWGVMATLFNYIPIFGAILGFLVLALVSVLSFDSMLYATLPPLAFAALTTIEGNLITPSVLGRSMSLNPILVFLTLIVWGWMWGIGGAFLAVPLLSVIKVACERFERTKPFAILMESERLF